MNTLLLILNRVYFLLKKVNNQSPFMGTIILVSLLIALALMDVELFVFAFKSSAVKTSSIIYFTTILIIFLGLYLYAKAKRKQITDTIPNRATLKNILAAAVFIFTIAAFIALSNINRAKIFQDRKNTLPSTQKPSLESKIRHWFE